MAQRIRAIANRRSLLISPDFPLTSPRLHTTSFSPHTSPISSAHCLKGPACHRGGEGAVGSREQDDERLDEVRIGRGPGADGEFLGWQCAGGGGISRVQGRARYRTQGRCDQEIPGRGWGSLRRGCRYGYLWRQISHCHQVRPMLITTAKPTMAITRPMRIHSALV